MDHIHLFKSKIEDFPSGPVVKTSPSNAGCAGLIPGQGAKIPRTLQPENQNMKWKQYCNKFNKDFKNGLHQKKILKKIKAYIYIFFITDVLFIGTMTCCLL